MDKKHIVVNVRFNEELHDALRKYCFDNKISINKFIVQLVSKVIINKESVTDNVNS